MIDLSKKYAQLGKTLMFTFFYAYLLPLGPLISLGSLVAIYWVEKILLLRRDSKPAPTGSDMAEEMVDFFGEFTLLLYAVYKKLINIDWLSYLGINIELNYISFDMGTIFNIYNKFLNSY